MSRALLVLCLLLLLPAGLPAVAAEEKPAAGPSDADLRIDLSGIGLPILREGRVVNFVFIRARIQLNPGLTKADIEAREPYIREGLVRSAYRTPLNQPDDFMTVDPKLFESALLREARAALGPKAVKSVQLRDQKAQKMVYVPRPGSGSSRSPIPP